MSMQEYDVNFILDNYTRGMKKAGAVRGACQNIGDIARDQNRPAEERLIAFGLMGIVWSRHKTQVSWYDATNWFSWDVQEEMASVYKDCGIEQSTLQVYNRNAHQSYGYMDVMGEVLSYPLFSAKGAEPIHSHLLKSFYQGLHDCAVRMEGRAPQRSYLDLLRHVNDADAVVRAANRLNLKGDQNESLYIIGSIEIDFIEQMINIVGTDNLVLETYRKSLEGLSNIFDEKDNRYDRVQGLLAGCIKI
jgi:hypothetical protein